MGDNKENLNDLFIELGEHQVGPFALGMGQGKDLKVYYRVYHSSYEQGKVEDIVDEGEDNVLKDEGDAEDDDADVNVSERALSVFTLYYVMELLSPS